MLFTIHVFLVKDNAPLTSHGYVAVVLLSARMSSRQELVLLLFLPKGIRWYLVCSCQVREVSVTK